MNESQISKQHPIPQNFMDVEFKIVGDFTVRQFTYLCGTGLPMYLIYNTPIQGFVKTVVLIILGLLGFLLVFVPIDDRSMDVWIVNFFKSVYSDNRRVWRKTPIIPKTLSMETIKIVQGEMITLAPTSSRRKLEEYLKGIKEEVPDEFDYDFNKFKFKEAAMVITKTTIKSSEPATIPEIPMFIPGEIPLPEPELEQTTTIAPLAAQPTVTQPTTPIVKIPEVSKEQPPKITIEEKLAKPVVEEVVIKIPSLVKPKEEVKPTPIPVSQPIIKKIVQPIRAMPSVIKEIIKPKPKFEKGPDIHEELRTSSSELPGRKFVSFSKKEQEIILPIRGERTIKLVAQAPAQNIVGGSKDIRTLTKELRTLVREIKQTDTTPTPVQPPVSNTLENVENNLSGICFSPDNQPLPNLMLVLLDSEDKELQYSRTDNLGKFIFPNTQIGNFKIKVLNPEIYRLNFDIITISIKEYPYTFIQILGKK